MTNANDDVEFKREKNVLGNEGLFALRISGSCVYSNYSIVQRMYTNRIQRTKLRQIPTHPIRTQSFGSCVLLQMNTAWTLPHQKREHDTCSRSATTVQYISKQCIAIIHCSFQSNVHFITSNRKTDFF